MPPMASGSGSTSFRTLRRKPRSTRWRTLVRWRPAVRSISKSTCSHVILPAWSSFVMSKPELARLRHGFLSSPEELIDEARNGRMFILVDDEDRENEGDLVIPAQMATPDAINFMARHGRGLICLALRKERVDQLGLQPLSRAHGSPPGTAFPASI